MTSPCTDFDGVEPQPPRTPEGCEECLEHGGQWVHLRVCLICGHVGCCDQSPGRHATAHFHDTDHAVIRSFEPGERWGWCYRHETAIPSAPGADQGHHRSP